MRFFNNMKFSFWLLVLFNCCGSFQCHLLEGLKDAVLNAENLFSDIFGSVDSLMKHVKFTKEAWKDSVEEECRFSCPNGMLVYNTLTLEYAY